MKVGDLPFPVERADEADFERRVLAREGRVAALFWADWCPYARRFLPVFESADLPGIEKVLVDVSDEGGLWDRYRIPVVPTVLVFVAGREVGRIDGVKGLGIKAERLDELRSPC